MRRVILIGLFILISHVHVNAQEYHPGDHELLLMPTAYTMPKGGSYFSDYELFFLNYTIAVTRTTHIGALTLFPITKDFLDYLTLGIKQQYFQNSNFAGAFWGTYTPKNAMGTFGNVFSIGNEALSGHLALSALFNPSNNNKTFFVFMLGVRRGLSEKFSFMLEYTNSGTAIEEGSSGGLLSVGVRFTGESVAWDIAGLKLFEDTGDLLFIPLLKATVYFD